MKKFLLILLLAVAFTFSGCTVDITNTNVKNDSTVEKAPNKEKSIETTTEQRENSDEYEEKFAEPDYMQLYADVLDRYHVFITHGEDIFDGSEGLKGFEEWGPYADSEKYLDFFGYVLKDLNNDDVPELLVGERDAVTYYEESNHILSTYTLVDGTPKLVFEGWGRNRYHFTENGGFFNEGSSGAASSSKTLYTVDENGNLVCHGCYFTEPNYDHSETYHYYNTTGEWDIEGSQILSEESIYELHPEFDEWYSRIVYVEMTPFSEYEVTDKNRIVPPAVTCKLFPEGLEGISSCEVFVPYPLETAGTFVVYSADKEVKDFKVLALDYLDYERSWHQCCVTEEVYALNVLTPQKPILVGFEMEAGGHYPRNGISYTDETGKTRKFALCYDFTGEYYPINLCEF